MKRTAFLHGMIYTMVSKEETLPFSLLETTDAMWIAQAMLIEDDHIAAIGSDRDISDLISRDSADAVKIVDLHGRCVIPAFNDSHCHLLATGLNLIRLNLRGVRSCAEIIERGKAFLAENPPAPGDWIVGFGFDQNLFDDPVLPDLSTAEAISSEYPVFLDRVCGHVGAVNRAALKAAGYDESTVIVGGVLERDADGHLNGILKEAALDRLRRVLPAPSLQTLERALLTIIHQANAFGLASVQTDDLENAPFDDIQHVYRKMQRDGTLTLRVYQELQQPRIPQLTEFLSRNLRTGDGDDFLKIGNIKLFIDGSLGARTAFLRNPYNDDPSTAGVAVYTQESLNEVVAKAQRNGMQVACHAIGDGAVAQVIQAAEFSDRQAGGASAASLRHRVVHCQFLDDALLQRMKDCGLCADIQPAFTASDYPIVDSRVGSMRGDFSYKWRTMAASNIPLGGSSDSPVETISPIWGIDCAVNRTDLNHKPEGGWHPEEALTVTQAVSLYTRGSAYLEFAEHKKGQLKAGMLADFLILSDDIFQIPSEEIRSVQILNTYVGGKCVYTNESRNYV